MQFISLPSPGFSSVQHCDNGLDIGVRSLAYLSHTSVHTEDSDRNDNDVGFVLDGDSLVESWIKQTGVTFFGNDPIL